MSKKTNTVKINNTIINIRSTYHGTAKLQDILFQMALIKFKRKQAQADDIIPEIPYNNM